MKWMIPWCRSRARGSATIAPTWSRSVPLSSRKPLPPVPSPWQPAAGSLRLRLGPFRTGRVCGAHATPPSRGSCRLRRACRSVLGPPRGRGTLACAGGPAVFVPLVGVWAPALLVATVAGAAPTCSLCARAGCFRARPRERAASPHGDSGMCREAVTPFPRGG